VSASSGDGGSGRKPNLIIPIVGIIICVLLFALSFVSCNDEATNSKNREKLANSTPYSTACIVDGDNWFSSSEEKELAKDLEYFYDKTGVQPYIVINGPRDYGNLTAESAMDDFASDWYDANIDNETTFLYMYFAPRNGNSSEIGYMAVVNGKQVSSIMDSEATEIFWNYLDKYWNQYDSDETVEMFNQTYRHTADTIMTRSTTGADVGMVAVKVLAIAGAIFFVFLFVRENNRRKHEEALETERILAQDLHTYAEEDASNLADKYLKEDK
jgi:hypothetical protein